MKKYTKKENKKHNKKPGLLTKKIVDANFSSSGCWCNKKEINENDLLKYNTIDKCAFQFNKTITRVSIPNEIKNIDHGAFLGCENLLSVKLPKSLKQIGIAVFADCINLKKVEFSESINYIPIATFSGCMNLTDIVINPSVNKICDRAFCDCSHLKLLIREEKVRVIGEDAFKNTLTFLKGSPSPIMNTKTSVIKIETKSKKPKPEGTKKHIIVTLNEYLNDYNYNNRIKDWHIKSGINNSQLVCSKCKDDDNWETILLDNNNHVCYFCWIKKPVKSNNLLVVKKSPTKKVATKKPVAKKQTVKKVEVKKSEPKQVLLPKPKKVNGIETTKKHIVIKSTELTNYNYDKRRKQWHANAGFNEKSLKCSDCKNLKHASVHTDDNKHICYNCFIKKTKK